MPTEIDLETLRQAAKSPFFLPVLMYLDLFAAWCLSELEGLDPRDIPVLLGAPDEDDSVERMALWMLYQGHVEQLCANPAVVDGGPSYEPVDSARLGESSCLVLTETGREHASLLLAHLMGSPEVGYSEGLWEQLQIDRMHPSFDKENRVFSWGRHILKCFRQPALNQQLILQAAEELGWPAWFDDPLPKVSGKNPKVRLHDTIQDLNRGQKKRLIHFKGDGTGMRVGWEFR